MKYFTGKFDLNGVVIAVESNRADWLGALANSISAPAAAEGDRAELTVELLEMEDQEIDALCPLPGDEYKLGENDVFLDQLVRYTGYQRDEAFWQEIGGYARIFIDYGGGRGTIYRRRDRKVINPFFADSFFAVNLMEKMLSSRQFYSIHASCAQVNGRGVIITGPGGRGKSTSGYALARQGHPFLNDERVLLKRRENYRACSISDLFKLRPEAVDRFFPELASIEPFYLPNPDEFCYKTGIMPGMERATECDADILLILKQVDQPGSEARPINPARAVGELFPVTMNLRNNKESIKKFDFLTDFLHQITCYQIDFGYDMDDFARLVSELTE
jgi:hypothetical protein